MPGKRKLPPQEDPVLSDAEEEDFEEVEQEEEEEEEDQATPAPTAAEVSFDGTCFRCRQRRYHDRHTLVDVAAAAAVDAPS